MAIKGQGLHNPHGGGNTYELERALDEDMLLTSVGWVNGYYQDGYQDVDHYTDEWGVTWKTIEYETRFGTGSTRSHLARRWRMTPRSIAMRRPIPIGPSCISKPSAWWRTYKDEYWIVA